MKAQDFDKAFDDGEETLHYLDLDSAHRPGHGPQRIDLELPKWMVDSIDRTAARLNETRQTIIKIWLAERLEGSTNGSADRRANE